MQDFLKIRCRPQEGETGEHQEAATDGNNPWRHLEIYCGTSENDPLGFLDSKGLGTDCEAAEKINQDGQCRHHSQLTFESHSHPKKGVARTEQRDMTRKARAILVIGKSRLVERKGERVACM